MSKTRQGDRRTVWFRDIDWKEMKREAERLDRSVSWVVRRAWGLARVKIGTIPTQEEVLEEWANE